MGKHPYFCTFSTAPTSPIIEEEVKSHIKSLQGVFIDDWDSYYMWYGEIHCGTNVKRTPPSINWWE